MHEYWITITFMVDARDTEEAVEIAQSIIEHSKKGPYKIKSGEHIETEEA